MKITIIGTGYVGLVTGTCFSEMGHKVYCIDIDESKIENLKKGILPIYEPHLWELVDDNYKKNRLIFTTNLKEGLDNSDIIFIAVGTPMDENGACNLKFVKSVAENIRDNITHDSIVVIKSTVPVGTCHEVEKIINENKNNVKIGIVSNPEFLKEGKAVEDCMHPDRIVIGADDPKLFETMKELYSSFTINHERFILMDVKSSELTKYAANAMLATRISFMNEISNICEKTGANIQHIRQGIGSDKRIGYDFLYAGCGYGGSCFPKDVQALIHTSQEYGYEPILLENVEKVNQNQKEVLVNKITDKYGEDLSQYTIGMWGLSFKPGTDDTREAPALTMIEKLIEKGGQIQAYCPKGSEETLKYFKNNKKVLENLKIAENRWEAIENSDFLILVTEWKEFRNINYEKAKKLMKTPVIFDGRNIYNQKIAKREGFELYQIGV